MSRFTQAFNRQLERVIFTLGQVLQNNFYLYLGALFSVFILVDALVFHVGENMRQKAFDLVVKQRLIVPQADKDIVIIDVDEKSLALMAQQYGRWPWPRQVFGELVELIQPQAPKAIVFDILFSDPDIYNPDSDSYFNQVLASSPNTYLPFLRLDASADAQSEIRASQIKSVQRLANTNSDPTLAVILPHFPAALETARLGTHNITPDKDGVVRAYPLWRDEQGWRIPSLPAVVQAANLPADLPASALLNWRGKPFTYTYYSLAEVLADLSSSQPKRFQDAFRGKTVLIGSTAPSLFDLKATTVASVFPGVEILATALDNIAHNDFLKTWQGPVPYVLLSILLLWLTVFAFYREVNRDLLNRVFSLSQIGLLVVSALTINLLNWYIDVTGPMLWALLFFSVAKIYSLLAQRVLQRAWLTQTTAQTQYVWAATLDWQGRSANLSPKQLQQWAQALEAACAAVQIKAMTIAPLTGQQNGLWTVWADVWVWSCAHPLDAAQVSAIEQQLRNQKIARGLQSLQLKLSAVALDAQITPPLQRWQQGLAAALAALAQR